MSSQTQRTRRTSWTNPERCPFCDAHLNDGGWGFIAHIRANPRCETEYDAWRERIASDMGGEWGG
ncbi:DUF7501 family protein [Haladaptatus caseinilyticus]|uniref:DUF7501 family protein n=1 Tax=Haladaptatus caseinilyticus TaxID=2993314 RepID=UPI00224AC50A|nr:hypothetical protein [Haladaptatus caseinilyticus]